MCQSTESARPWDGGSPAVIDLLRALLLLDVDVEEDARDLLRGSPERYEARRGVLYVLERLNEAAAPAEVTV